jgi:hypothetical protein
MMDCLCLIDSAPVMGILIQHPEMRLTVSLHGMTSSLSESSQPYLLISRDVTNKADKINVNAHFSVQINVIHPLSQ